MSGRLKATETSCDLIRKDLFWLWKRISARDHTKPQETRADCHCRKALPSGKNRTKWRGWWICKEVASTCSSKCILLRLRCKRLVTLLSVAAKGCISCCEQSSELRVRTGKGECGLWQVYTPLDWNRKSTGLQSSLSILTQLCGHTCSCLFERLTKMYFQSYMQPHTARWYHGGTQPQIHSSPTWASSWCSKLRLLCTRASQRSTQQRALQPALRITWNI